MSKRSSKLLAAFLAVGMTFSMAACGNVYVKSSENVGSSETKTSTSQVTVAESSTSEEKSYYNETGYPICDEPITIRVGGQLGGTTDWQNTLMVKTIEEKLGIKLVCEPVPNDAYATNYATMLATGDMPDMIIWGVMPRAQVNKDGQAGYWLDISDYLDIMPNFAAYLEENPSYANYQKTEDGSIYGLGRVTRTQTTNLNSQIFYDKSLAEAAGVEEINTVDDFYEALKLVKKAYPDKIPLGATINGTPAGRIDIILQVAFGIETFDAKYILQVDENGKVGLADISDNYREYLKFMNKLYDEGLLNQDAMTITEDEYLANLDAGKYVFYSNDAARQTKEITDAINAGQHELKANMGRIFALTSEYQEEKTYVKNHGVHGSALFYVNAETEYPEAICRLLDYFTTEEGLLLANYGIEGVTFDYVDDGYGNKILDTDKYLDLSKYDRFSKWRDTEIIIQQALAFDWSFKNKYLSDLSDAQLEKIVADTSASSWYDASMLLQYRNDVVNKQERMLNFVYTDEESTERNIYYNDLVNYLPLMKANFISGKNDINSDDEWNAYIKEVENMGYEKLMKIEQAGYDRLMSASSN